MKYKTVIKVFNYVDVWFLYIALIYGVSKVYQFMFAVESVWQTSWDNLQVQLGKGEAAETRLMNF